VSSPKKEGGWKKRTDSQGGGETKKKDHASQHRTEESKGAGQMVYMAPPPPTVWKNLEYRLTVCTRQTCSKTVPSPQVLRESRACQLLLQCRRMSSFEYWVARCSPGPGGSTRAIFPGQQGLQDRPCGQLRFPLQMRKAIFWQQGLQGSPCGLLCSFPRIHPHSSKWLMLASIRTPCSAYAVESSSIFVLPSNIWLSTFHLLARIRLQKASKNAAVTLSRKPFKV
jgi:hypothetical protein